MKEGIKSDFIEYNKLLIVGVIAGIISGIFSLFYQELRPQTNNFYQLLFGSLFITGFYYILFMILTFILYTVLKFLFKK